VSEVPTAADRTLTTEEAERVDRACDRFEEAWRSGARPALKDFVEEPDAPVGRAMLRELLKVELAYRAQLREQPTAETYQAIFPAHAALIAAIFKRFAEQPTVEPTVDEFIIPQSPTRTPVADGAEPQVEEPSKEPPEMRPTVPGYTIEGVLGWGAMGIVYKAWQQEAKRYVALKLIRDSFLADPKHRKRFRSEAEAAARFEHPNLVRIYHVGEHQGLLYFSMQWGEHGSLDKRLAKQAWPAVKAAETARTLAEAIHYAHEKNIIHRDLKPANIVLTGDDQPLITDFGLAKRLDRQSARTLTNAVMGTAAYMPPEQASGDAKSVGPAADVYSLGAILYEMLTGRPPFQGDTVAGILQQVLHNDPVPPRQIQPDIPGDLEAVCLKCLEKETEQRYAQARALAEDLGCFLRGEPLSISQMTEWDRQARWARRAGFEILDIVGGSRHFGIVYKAKQLRLDRTVLLKTVSAPAQADPEAAARFRREGQTLAQMQHPNIVQVYDLGEHGGQAYMATEYVEGGTLAEKLLETPWPPRQAVALVATLARAVHYAHQRGILHSALRPFNILLTAEDVPKITNFGLDRLLETEPRTTSPRRPTPQHVTNYMAPEQTTLPRGRMGPATDVYALGAILYELLTGRVPITADDLTEFLRRVRFEPALPPSHWRADLPRSLDTVCLNCLCKVPEERYAGAEALAEALQRFLTGDQQNTEEVELIPGYSFEEELGRGGLGIVYKARQISLDRPVAVKVFHAMVPPPVLSHVRAANKALAHLHHPNLLQVYDSGERDGLLYVAEELVDGVRLDQKCAGVPQPPHEAARLMATLAQAIDFAHRHGVVHCNLKPQVVLLPHDGVPKISSFDVAKLPNNPDQPADTAATNVVTPIYMAPEQAGGKPDEIGPATDVYALGNILYEMLTGRRPFHEVPFRDLLDQLRYAMPKPPRELQSSLPEDLETICLGCLEKAPGKRYTSAALLAEDLNRFLAGKPLLQSSPQAQSTGTESTSEPAASGNTGSPESQPNAWKRLTKWFARRSSTG
jgi:serine/threonine protein kinase